KARRNGSNRPFPPASETGPDAPRITPRDFCAAMPYMRGPMPDTLLMPIPGQVDPVPVARDITPRADGRADLIGLARPRIAELFAQAGLDTKQARLRAKQVYHWLYHRGVTDFAAMTDIAKQMRPWLAERFVIGRPEVVEAQHSTDGTRKWLLRTADGHD